MTVFGLSRTILLTITLVGCGTVSTYQRNCEEIHSGFAAQMACTKEKVRSDWRSKGQNADLVNLYLNSADVLVEHVEKGAKTEAQARLELSQLYVELKNIQGDRQLKDLYKSALWESIHKPITPQIQKPVRTNCTTIGNSTNCTSR